MQTPLLVALAFVPACAQDVPGRRPPIVSNDDAAQLSEYIVAALADSRGDLWFGTNGQGAIRYTPAISAESKGELRYVSLAEGLVGDVVTDIVEDRDGRLWFGTHTGVSRYDAPGAQPGAASPFRNFGEAEGLRGSGCKLLVDRSGAVWAGTDAGVFRFDGARFQPFALPIPERARSSYKIVPGKVWDLCEDRRGHVWIARDGYGACRYDPSAASVPGADPFLLLTQADGLCSDNVASIVEDALGRIWFGCITSDHPQWIAEGGLCRYDPSSAGGSGRPAITQFPGEKGLTANDVYNLYVDRRGHVWIGAVRVGAYRYDPALEPGGEPFTLFDVTDRPDLTTSFGIQAMEEDRHGTLWFGFSGGLFRFDGTSFVNVTRGGPWSSP